MFQQQQQLTTPYPALQLNSNQQQPLLFPQQRLGNLTNAKASLIHAKVSPEQEADNVYENHTTGSREFNRSRCDSYEDHNAYIFDKIIDKSLMVSIKCIFEIF